MPRRRASHDPEAEHSLVSAILVRPAGLPAVAPIVTPGDFYDPTMGIVWATLLDLHNRNTPIDPVTVAAHLGGTEVDLDRLVAEAHGISNPAAYARIVAEHAQRRRLQAAAIELAEDAADSNDLATLVTRYRQILDDVAHATAQQGEGLSGRIAFDDTFWTRNREGEQWLIEPVLALGRAHSLYAPAKAGKSLLALEIAAGVASGRHVLGQPTGPPRTVLYVDLEMTEDDIYERLCDLGYGPDDDLTQFHYHLHPALAPLDTAAGGAALVAHGEAIHAELVVIDTVARTISGEENSADTINGLARHTFTPLKARMITSLRVDHAGKDLAKGQRGTSAKNDDVDVVWQMTVTDTGISLKATHRRLSWVPPLVALTREEQPLTHKLADYGWPAGTKECAVQLDDLEVPVEWGRDKARQTLTKAGIKVSNAVLASAIKWRKTLSNEPPDSLPEDDFGSFRGQPENTTNDQGGQLSGQTRTEARGHYGQLPPPKGGQVQSRPETDEYEDF